MSGRPSLPVDRNGHQIEYGRRRADDVHGDVVVAHELGQRPLAVVDLRKPDVIKGSVRVTTRVAPCGII